MRPIFKSERTELRSFDFEVRAREDEEHGAFVEGVPIVFGRSCDIAGLYEETIARGALDKTDLKDVRFLVNHNTEMTPLARSRNNNKNSTMQMEVKEDGMHIRVNLDIENNTDARNLYSAIKRGDVSGMSFMFMVRGDEWEDLDTDYPKRTVTDIEKVFEVSAVTFPAYDDTTIKARSSNTLESARKELESARAQERAEAEAIVRGNEERARRIRILELSGK